MSIKGYSERRILNSIAYFLEKNSHFIFNFIGKLGIILPEIEYEYIFLIEQSFSDFGDSDLVIIIKKQNSVKLKHTKALINFRMSTIKY